MDKAPPVVPANLPLARLAARMAEHDPVIDRHQGVLLVDAEGLLAGILTRGDILRTMKRVVTPGEALAAMDAAGAEGNDVRVSHPDETLHDVIGRLLKYDIGRLPVVSRQDGRRIVGYLGRADILKARGRSYEEEEVRESWFHGFAAGNFKTG